MQGKTRSWADVQLIISSISIAVTLGFWGLMTSREKNSAAVRGEATIAAASASTSSSVQMLLPGQVLYLGGAPAPAPAPVMNQRKHRRGGGDGGGGGGAAASTGSS